MSKFDEFWQQCPKKVGKIACRKSYQRQLRIVAKERPEADPHEVLRNAMRVYARSQRVADGYVTNPLTWLNEGRYLDEPEPVKSNGKVNGHSFMDQVTKDEMARAREVKAELRRKRTPVLMNFDLTRAFEPGWQPPKPWYFPIADRGVRNGRTLRQS